MTKILLKNLKTQFISRPVFLNQYPHQSLIFQRSKKFTLGGEHCKNRTIKTQRMPANNKSLEFLH